MVEVLVEGGAQVNQQDSEGNTALHVALILGLAPLVSIAWDEETGREEGSM